MVAAGAVDDAASWQASATPRASGPTDRIETTPGTGHGTCANMLDGWYGKLIGAIAGYLVGRGWLGALVGLVLGHQFDV